jgi:hypothetical protein
MPGKCLENKVHGGSSEFLSYKKKYLENIF